MIFATDGQFSTIANIATVFGAGFVMWGAAARLIKRIRESGGLHRLSKFDVKVLGFVSGLVVALIVELLVQNYDLRVYAVANHQLTAQYLAGVKIIERFGREIVHTLNACFSHIA